MKSLGKGGILLIVIAIILVLWGVGKYNSLVSLKQSVEKYWADVEAQYQRRADLIPNLVNTVKGYAAHESETFQAVTEARTKATQTQINIENGDGLTPEAIEKFQAAQNELTGALGRLIAVAENYPELKADGLFQDLQSQLEGTENRINVARQDFNKAAKDFNTKVLKFPTNIIAKLFGFDKTAYFAAEEGTDKAPVVEF